MAIQTEGMCGNMNIFRLNDRLPLSIHCTSFYRTRLGKNALNNWYCSCQTINVQENVGNLQEISCLPTDRLCSSHIQDILLSH